MQSNSLLGHRISRTSSTTQGLLPGENREFLSSQSKDFKKLKLEDFLECPENPLKLEHEILSMSDSVKLLRKRGVNRKRRSACRGPSSSDIRKTHLQEHKKDRYEFEVLLNALKKCQFFRSVSDVELKELCKYFSPVYFRKGDPIIVQNDVGTSFYVIEKGNVDIYKAKPLPSSPSGNILSNKIQNKVKNSPLHVLQSQTYSSLGANIQNGQNGNQKVHPKYGTYITTLSDNNYFGEISILLKCKRTASCIAATDVKCWELQSEAFHKIGRDVKVSQFGAKLSLLRRMDLFSILPEHHLENIVKNMKLETYKPSKVIVQQGETGSYFYIILKGKVRVMKNDEMVGIIREGSYFGEIALIDPLNKRNATVVAIREVQCGVLNRECFHSSIFNTVYQRVLLNQISKYDENLL